MRKTITLRVAILFLTALTVRAERPSQERGFRADSVYSFSDLDSVNLFNGNLNLQIPIGQTYRVSPTLSYQLNLRYAGKIWRYLEYCPRGSEPDCRVNTLARQENAGLGWNLSFGSLAYHVPGSYQTVTGFTYVSPDGSEHEFYKVLHHGDPEDTNDLDGMDVTYTRDGSYLRMKKLSANTRVIEFPSGQKHRFVLDSVKNVWMLSYIYDGFSGIDSESTLDPVRNYVKFTYPVNATNSTLNDIRIEDSHHRVHTITFKPAVGTGGVPRIATVTLETFGGATAAYAFRYKSNGTNEGIDLYKPVLGSLSTKATVALLAGIDFPLGESFDFEYSIPTAIDPESGTLQEMRLPTRGKVEWDYDIQNSAADPAYPDSVGVSKRRFYNSINGSYKLEQYTKYVSATGSNTVMTMAGWTEDANPDATAYVAFKNVNYFVTAWGPQSGLPRHLNTKDAAGRYLSTETFDCAGGTCSKKRETYIDHELDWMDAVVCTDQSDPCITDRNRRINRENRLDFATDGVGPLLRNASVTSSEFDGLGNYRRIATGGDYVSGNVKSSFTAYNSRTRGGQTVGEYRLDGNGQRMAGFFMLQRNDPWVLGTYTDQSVTEGTTTFAATACFDIPTNFMKRKLTPAGATPGAAPGDLLAVFTPDPEGNVSTEEYFGGEAQSISTGADLCAIGLPVHTAQTVRIDHTYQYGSMKTSQYKDASGGTGSPGEGLNFLAADLDIDKSTGLVLTSRDSAGIATGFVYDQRGRLTDLHPSPGNDAWVHYAYSPATASARAQVDVTYSPNQSTSGTLGRSIFEYDGMGRVYRERRRLADGSWSSTDSRYDHAGRRSKVSSTEQWVSDAAEPANWTTTTYDVLGRPASVRTPDNKQTLWTYQGTEFATRMSFVANLDSGTEMPASVEERYDRQGRLTQVTEDADGSSVVTNYTYDPGDRLSTVQTLVSGIMQQRTFHYDGRGLLTWEQQPESARIDYTYDARGHVISRTTQGGAALMFGYDRAERLLTVSQTGVGILKSLSYNRDNSSHDFSRGKLASATRHNWLPDLGDVRVTETYVYGGIGGRMSKKTTQISTGETFSDDYTYDALGNLASTVYPVCTGGTCPGLTSPPRTVTNTFTNGQLTKVNGYADPIQYHPNGMMKSIQHKNAPFPSGLPGNGPLYEQTIAADAMARPSSISVSNFCANYKIDQQPQSASIQGGQSVSLSVTATGATGWQWYDGNDLPLSNTNAPSITVSPQGTTKYWARVSNGSCTVDSAAATVSVAQCTPPDATIHAAGSLPASGSDEAWVTDTPGATYNWSITGGTITSNTGSRISYRANCTGSVNISVTVTKNCASSDTHQVTIVPLSVTLSGAATITQGSSTTLSAALNGTPPWSLTWSPDNVVQNGVSTSPKTRSVTPGATTTYLVSATDAYGCSASSNNVVVTVKPPVPTAVAATASGPNTVTITWSYSGQADRFDIERYDRLPGSPASYVVRGSTQTGAERSFANVGIPADTAYLYQVRAVKGGTSSDPSAIDLATTTILTDDPLIVGGPAPTPIRAAHIMQLRTAVNAVRALAQSGPFVFTDSSLAGLPVRRAHITELRAALDAARLSLVLPAVIYQDDSLPAAAAIDDAHVMDLRWGVK